MVDSADFKDVAAGFYSPAPYCNDERRSRIGAPLLAAFLILLAVASICAVIAEIGFAFYEFGAVIDAMPAFDIVDGQATVSQSPLTLTSRHGVNIIFDTRQNFDGFYRNPPRDTLLIIARDGVVAPHQKNVTPFRGIEDRHIGKTYLYSMLALSILGIPIVVGISVPILLVVIGWPALLSAAAAGMVCAFVLAKPQAKMDWRHGARIAVLIFLPGLCILEFLHEVLHWFGVMLLSAAPVIYTLLGAILCASVLLPRRQGAHRHE